MVVDKDKIRPKFKTVCCNLCGKMIIGNDFEYSKKRNMPPVFVCHKCLNKHFNKIIHI